MVARSSLTALNVATDSILFFGRTVISIAQSRADPMAIRRSVASGGVSGSGRSPVEASTSHRPSLVRETAVAW